MRMHPEEPPKKVIEHARPVLRLQPPAHSASPPPPHHATQRATHNIWLLWHLTLPTRLAPENLDGFFTPALPKDSLDRRHGRLIPAKLERGLAAPVVVAARVFFPVRFDCIVHVAVL